MANRSIPLIAFTVLIQLASIPCTLAGSSNELSSGDSISGISTRRLSSKQLRIWREVEKIAEAEDGAGQPLHPKLHGLWQWANGKGHIIEIDATGMRGSNEAGRTTLDAPDGTGRQRTVILWLNIYAIDNAKPNLASRLSDGLEQSRRLGRFARYAEIAGHELTHAYLMIENPEYARLCSNLRDEADEYVSSLRRPATNRLDGEAIKQRQARIGALVSAIEKPAEAAELEIWHELQRGQGNSP